MAATSKQKHAKCYNCIHRGSQFKIAGKTHMHCEHPKHEESLKNYELSPWDTLREFWETCEDHEFKAN